MKFRIGRTSLRRSDLIPPCEEATRESCINTEIRGTDDPRKIPSHLGDSKWWYSDGKNHRLVEGYIARDFESEDWFIEFETLESLVQFTQKYGEIAIFPKEFECMDVTLEIIDDYSFMDE